MESIKQTATEWFFEQLTKVDYNCINKTFLQNNNSLAGYRLRELFEQAKEMEKEQIVNAVDGFPLNNRNLEGEQYYEQTYGGKNE
jgi:hypothetical protein